jgi:hypothetical protein
MPVCEKTLPFELTCSLLLTANAPGYPKPIKLQEQHRALFPSDKPINEQSGKLVQAWASGSKSAAAQVPESSGAIEVATPTLSADPSMADTQDSTANLQAAPSQEDVGQGVLSDATLITANQALEIEARCSENGIDPAKVKARFGIERFSMMTIAMHAKASSQISATIAKRQENSSTVPPLEL